MKLFPGESIIEGLNVKEKQIKDLILVTNKGSFIKHCTNDIKISKKGGLGIIGINFKNNKKSKNRLINCFIKNKYVYIKTDKERYEKLNIDQINSSEYKKEKKLNINLNENEFIKSIFSMVLPESN